MSTTEDVYKFKFIDKKFESVSGKENKDLLIKWLVIFFRLFFIFYILFNLRGMRGKLRTSMYTFDKQFHLGKKNSFILVNYQVALLKLYKCLIFIGFFQR